MASSVSAMSILMSFAYAVLLLYVSFIPSSSLAVDVIPSYPDAIAELREAIVKGFNFQSEDFVVTGFDPKEALVGHSVAYEFDVEIDDQILPVKLLEDVSKWEYVDLPIFRVQETQLPHGLEPVKQTGPTLPVLAPFQLAGPMEIWIQDAQDMRLSLPHDVDAGVLRKVILAEGAVVTVKGARSVSLRNPIKFPLPLNQTQNAFASSLLSLAEQLHQASLTSETPLLSLRIVGPTSITSPSSSSSSPSRLKLKRLAPGFVHLSSQGKSPPSDALSEINPEEKSSLLTPKRFSAMWPLASLNVSNPNLMGFEKLLVSVLGKKKGFFRLLKADVSAQTYAKIGFEVVKKVKEGDLLGLPEWRTKPETIREHFEVLGKVEGKKVIPERVVQVDGSYFEDSFALNVAMGNVSMSTVPLVNPPPIPFTL